MSSRLDTIVIGGGVNGCGVARDLALRGLRVALVEKGDLASGTSGHSSSMIHGGPRYLMRELHVTRASATDAGYIRRIGRHLTFRVPFLMPIYRRASRAYVEAFEAFWEAYDRFQPLKGGKPHTRLGRAEVLRVEPGLSDAVAGAVTFDEWGIDGARLCIANALDAREHGAAIHTHRAVVRLLRDGERVVGVGLDDGATLEAPAVVNVAGPWAPRVAALAGVRVRVRPGKGVHLFYPRRIASYGVMALAVDRRWIFVEPHQNGALLGTTDDDYYGSLDALRPTQDETEYLLEAMATVLPGIRRHRFVRVTVGVRPTLYAWGRLEDDLSRDHAIYDHAEDGAPGLLTMIGGKLAAYRAMCEELADAVARRLGNDAPCRTHVEPLPGAEGPLPDAEALAESRRVPPIAAVRLGARHGCRAPRVIDGGPTFGRTPLCPCEPTLACEVAAAIRDEDAATIDDVRRRTRLAEGQCQGATCIGRAAPLFCDAGADVAAVHRSVAAALDERFRGRVPALDAGGANLAQEELLQGRYFLVGDYARVAPAGGAP